jgi:hypothetical protein
MYIMVTSFSGGRSRRTRREPLTMGKQLVNFITGGSESSAPFLLAHLALGQVSYCHHFSYVVCRPSTFHILIFSSETTGPIVTKLWWNGPWMAPFQNCVRWSRLPTKMVTNLKIEKRGDEILIGHCCFSVSQNELKF